MFDIGFWELSLIGIIALLVIGPERLPAVARTVGKYVGRANRFISNVKNDISKELKDEDLKRILADQQKLADDFKNAASSVNSSINSEAESLRGSVSMDDILEIEESDSKAKEVNTEKGRSDTNASEQLDSGPLNSNEQLPSSESQANTEKS